MNGNTKESAVSETIAVTLIVALTVIMAALVAAYVFGMIPSIPVSRTVAYTVEQPDVNTLIIVYHGGPDAGTLSFAEVSVTESGGGTPTFLNSTGFPNSIISKDVGSKVVVTSGNAGGFTDRDHVIVKATFTNNQEQIALNTFI